MSFFAGIEMPTDSSLTKTILDGSPIDTFRNVLWEYQDEVYVTNGLQSSKFINTCQGTSEVALLEGELSEGTNYFAAYPYKMVTSSFTSGFTINLPSEQTYCKDGIESESFPMVAQSNDGVFNFKNLCGIFVLQLTGDKTISSITFSGKDVSGNAIPVAGCGSVSLDYLISPSLSIENSSITSVTLKSSEGVCLNTSLPTSFHIVLPVGTYNTFMLVIKATDGSIMTVNSEKSLEIKRSNRTTAANLSYTGVINYHDLNEFGETANSYIVSQSGNYKFKSVKGCSTESVGNISSVEVLWESFGTSITPNIGDLISDVSYSDGYIQFSTSSTFREGNAVLAAKDASGTILWSWHIWMTDQPEDQIYTNNAGTMMDRNLGATSATPGDIGALGLLYQWGRKDPFIGSSSIENSIEAKSTITWPSPIESSASSGTITYATKNPTTFITSNDLNYDWYYTGDSNTDNLRWQSEKTIHDPCPSGWRVPDGGTNSIWDKSGILVDGAFNDTYKGVLFPNYTSTAWYPSSGYLDYYSGILKTVGTAGYYWSTTIIHDHEGVCFGFVPGYLGITYYRNLAYGMSVRCIRK